MSTDRKDIVRFLVQAVVYLAVACVLAGVFAVAGAVEGWTP